ncbi:iron chelate uptake ABC transporter family permease subunit [Paracoccus alcaliphilus]|uniref:iron chelate uptake ABC transporter family permease subunit n=1 Tax=Paracoccus alcaliphilus TaxID=34002 RepID=UPI000B84B0E7|nr:iron chelate uptake ABC transporter family permease subunit [Paracoccus alcaliphilus]
MAHVVGIPVARMRLWLLGLTACATAAAVLTVGPLTFVGLPAPHLARLTGFQRPASHLAASHLAASVLGRVTLSGRRGDASAGQGGVRCARFQEPGPIWAVEDVQGSVINWQQTIEGIEHAGRADAGPDARLLDGRRERQLSRGGDAVVARAIGDQPCHRQP